MKRKLLWKWAGLIGLVCLALVVLIPPAQAFEGRAGDTVVIAAGEVIDDDLYVGAGSFTLEGAVKGDLVVVGSTIEINGTVEGDLMAAGQSVTVNGVVMDDARIAGAVLTLRGNAQIADDVIGAGYSLETQAGSSVGGDLVFGGYQALLAGDIEEDVSAGAGGLALRGSVGGNVDADVGEPGDQPPFSPFMFMPGMPAVPSVSPGLTVGEGAKVGGNLDYTSAAEVDIPAGSVAGEITRQAPVVEAEEEAPSPTVQLLDHLRRFVALLLVGLLMLWLVPAGTQRVADVLQARLLPSLGWGVVSIAAVILAFLVILVAMILLAVVLGFVTLDNLVGIVIVLGLLALFVLAVLFAIAVAYVTKIAVSFSGGRLILARLNPEWAGGRVWPLVVGLVIFVILTAIPWLGGLINLVVVLLGLGVLWLLGRESLRQRPATPGTVEA